MQTHTSSIDQLHQQLLSLAPHLRDTAESMVRNNPDYGSVAAVPAALIQYLCEASVEKLGDACRGYISFCETFMEKQVDFVRTQHYKEEDYGRINAKVYQNPDYMSNVYYPALLLSYLFSSNYFAIYRIFCNSFVPLARSLAGSSCEIGIGHGLLSATLLSTNPRLAGYGVDISPSAPKMTARVASFFDLGGPIKVGVGDATIGIKLERGTPYEVMICAEVLEHLPDPAILLSNIYTALADNGILFLTASINMESVDHLYVFRSDSDVVNLVQKCGFRLLEQHLAVLTVQPYRDNDELTRKLMRRGNPATAILILAKESVGVKVPS